MTTNYHDAIATGAAANASVFNDPLGDLDAQITANTAAIAAIGGGATVSNAQLIEWTEGEDYEMTNPILYDADNVITAATVKWPDGSGGTFTRTDKDLTWLAIEAYTITHTVSSKTVTQAAVTRDANGNVTTKPVLTVA